MPERYSKNEGQGNGNVLAETNPRRHLVPGVKSANCKEHLQTEYLSGGILACKQSQRKD